MSKILLPIDGSDRSERAVAQVLQRPDGRDQELHLLNVQLPVDGNVQSFVDADALRAYHRDEGLAALVGVRRLLEQANVPYQHHIMVGHPADVIQRLARDLGVDEIVLVSHGRTGLREWILGSVATEVSQSAACKVTVVA